MKFLALRNDLELINEGYKDPSGSLRTTPFYLFDQTRGQRSG